MADTDLPFQIRVLEGDLATTVLQEGQPPGMLLFTGWSLPRVPIKFRSSQRKKKTFYTGNPNGRHQVLGPELAPTIINGKFRDRYLGDGEARRLMDLIDDIMGKGLSVECTWGMGVSGTSTSPLITGVPIVRVGIIADAEWSIEQVTDIEFAIELDWRSRGGPPAPVAAAASMVSARAGMSRTTADLNFTSAMWDAYREGPLVKPFGIPPAVHAAMSDAMEAIGTAVDGLDRASETIGAVAIVPLHEARSVVSACTGAIDAVDRATDLLLSISPLALEVRDSALDLLRNVAARFDVLGAFTRAQGSAAEAAGGVMENADPDVIAEVTAPAGTDLRDIAFKVYGDPELWWAIAQYNDIDGSSVPAPPTGPSDDPNRPIRIPSPTVIANLDVVC